MEQQGILQLASICDDELPAYLEVIDMAKGLGEETEGLTLARCRGWRFVTTDKRALQFAAKFMGDITVLHMSDLLDEVVAAGGLSREEVDAFLINAMPGYRN